MKGTGKTFQRLTLITVSAAVTLLAVEGALSLFTNRSLKPQTPFEDQLRAVENALQQRAAQETGGHAYTHHPDPYVAFVLRPGERENYEGAPVKINELGVRKRTGPLPTDEAMRIVVVGDSVAFGLGLEEGDTIAAQLERILRDASASPVVCETVAVPGWNHRNAVHFLLDHFGSFEPDVVIYIPVHNDLADTFQVTDTGRIFGAPDVASHDPFLCVSLESHILTVYQFADRIREGLLTGQDAIDFIGPFTFASDLTPESRRRYDANADSIELLRDLMSRKGGRFCIMHYTEKYLPDEYVWILRERLLDRKAGVLEVPGWTRLVTNEFTRTPSDNHPNSEGAGVLALWIAEALIENGWVKAAPGRSLEARLEPFKEYRAPARTEAEVRSRASEMRRQAMNRLQEEINLETGRGFCQVFGGVNRDGSIGMSFLAALKAAGPRIQICFDPLPDSSWLYPVEVDVEINEVSVGNLVVTETDQAAVAWFDLPDAVESGSAVEVRLRPERWLTRTHGKRSFPAAFLLQWIRSTAE